MKPRRRKILVRKYEKPEMIGSIYVNPAWKTDNSRALWEVIESSPEANDFLKMDLEPDWILITPPRSGVFVWWNDEGKEVFTLDATVVARIVPWTTDGTVKMIGDKIKVKPDEPVKKTSGGIVIADTQVKRSVTGVAEDLGPEVSAVSVGDRVMYSYEVGAKVEVEGEVYVILREEEVMMVIDPETEVGHEWD